MPTCYSTLDNFMLSHLKPNNENFVNVLNPQGYTTDIISWDHDGTNLDELNIFYDASYTSSLEIVSNYNPSSVKIFKAISIEGNGNWGGNAYTNVDRGGEPQQESSGFEFEEKEGAFYSDIPSSITDDPNDTSKIHVDSHSHADMMKSIQELKDMLISMKSALATFMEREK